MSKSKGKTTTNQTQSGTSTNTLDPMLQSALFGNYQRAVDLGNTTPQPFTGQSLSSATGIANAIPDVTAMTYVPDSQRATTIDPTAFGYQGISNYLNPYTQDVINASAADIERQRQIAGMTDAAKASAAGAFGGSRHGVADALTNEAYGRNLNSTIAGLRNQGFETALQAAMADAGAINQRSSQQAALDAARAAADAQAANRSYEFNIGTNVGAQGQNQSAMLQRAGLLGQLGSQEYGQYQDQRDYPLTIQQLINQSLGLVPSFGTTSTSGTMSGTGTSKTSGFNIGDIAKAAAAFSDERLKEDIKTIGYDEKGRRWVSYRYKWDSANVKHTGVIAQEVMETDPQAVAATEIGFLMVDYGRLH